MWADDSAEPFVRPRWHVSVLGLVLALSLTAGFMAGSFIHP